MRLGTQTGWDNKRCTNDGMWEDRLQEESPALPECLERPAACGWQGKKSSGNQQPAPASARRHERWR